MIDIPGIYVGRFKDNPNNKSKVMTRRSVPTYTDDNWANVESTGTIWRYNAETGEWVDTGLEEILVEEVTGTKEIIAEGTVPWKLQGLNVYGKSTQASTTGAQLFNTQQYCEQNSEFYQLGSNGGIIQLKPDDRRIFGSMPPIRLPAGTYTIFSGLGRPQAYANGSYIVLGKPGKPATFSLDADTDIYLKVYIIRGTSYPTQEYFVMLNAGSTALPWEPYTGGQPSPSPDYPQEIITAGSDGTIDITVSDGADQSQQLAIRTPNGLPGIPVDYGGNYTDVEGRRRWSDIIDYNNGKKYQYVNEVVVDGTNVKFTANSANTHWNLPIDSAPRVRQIFNTQINKYFPNNVFLANAVYDFIFTTSSKMEPYFETVEELNAFCVQKNTEGNPLTIMYVMDTPIETPLSEDEIAAYKAIHTYDGTTIIETDEDVSGMSAKVVTDVISKNEWFDPSAELALYYKALAGFASLEDLPMPHSRESSLVRKLLDSEYELGFSVNENSSRNERYLWDLINGTSTMLTNVPKSDTEKFLHVMIGGTVEEYPTVDTELDYWMDKCVNYMNSNGSIGE